jgi:uncharacterized FAD-dependent dehydrogenase
MFDVVIIGAGPAGLGAAYSLIKNSPQLKVALFEAGSIRDRKRCILPAALACKKCENCETISGFGGCFLPFHASKLSFPPSGKRLAKIMGDDEYRRICKTLWSLYCKLIKSPGLPYPTLKKNIDLLERSVLSVQSDLTLIKYPVHVSTEKEHSLFINEMRSVLEKHIKVFGNQFVDLERDIDMKNKILTLHNGDILEFKDIFLATGRRGFNQTQQFFTTNKISKKEENVNIGVRYMLPSKYLNIISESHPDFKLNLKTQEAELETFCLSNSFKGGCIDFLKYDEFLNLDGHISVNTKGDVINNLLYGNFAILYKNRKTNTAYREIVSRIDKMGSCNFKRVPIEYHLFAENKSEASSFFTESELKNIISFSTDVFKIIAGLNGIEMDSLLREIYVYAPEIENIWGEVALMDDSFRVADNVFAIGDCTGLAQGVVSSMAMGYKAGEMYGR